MAVSAGLGFDLDEVLDKAKDCDKVLGNMVKKGAEFSKNMHEAFNISGSKGIDKYIDSLLELSDLAKQIGSTKLSIDVDTPKMNQITDAFSDIAELVDRISSHKKFGGLFDTNAIYSSTRGYMEIGEELEKVTKKIQKNEELFDKYSDRNARGFFMEDPKAYFKGLGLWKGMSEDERKFYTEASEEQLRQISRQKVQETKIYRDAARQNLQVEAEAFRERRAMLQEEYDFRSQTADKQAKIIQNQLDKETKALQRQLDEVESAYTKLLNRRDWLQSKIKGVDVAQKETGIALSPEQQKIYDSYVTEEAEVNAKIEDMRRQHGATLNRMEREFAQNRVDIAKELRAQVDKYASISSGDAQGIIANSKNASNILQEQKAIRELIDARARLDKNDANYENTLKSLNAEIKRHQTNIDKITNAEKRRADIQRRWDERRAKREEAQRGTYQGALDYSREAKSLNDIKKALDYLDKARRRENLQTEVGQRRYRELTAELNRQQSAYNRLAGEVKKSSRGMMDIVGQLGRRLALAFSVSQISGYVKKLMDVRGEFELQQRSLQSILQNKDEADKLWNRTAELAVRSPFRVKELVTYTKQLAAYRIETEKLYDTNKMLADISAGLDVSMDRLILAYGQVRASSYLRGTELRQFTEAGVPLLEELSKYFTELEGRAVSIGDVFERISKRMVDFKDVEEILRRMTSEGGIFFEMQEIQAETLQGQLSNLKDSIDLMLNDIGKASDGVMKDSVKSVANLVKNWREVAFTIKEVVVAMSPYLASMALARIANSKLSDSVLGLVLNLDGLARGADRTSAWLTRFSTRGRVAAATAKLLRNALMSLTTLTVVGVFSVIAIALATMIRKMTQASREAKQLRKELDAIFTADVASVDKTIKSYERLVERLGEVNRGSKEHRDIIGQLNSGYSDYLGYIVNEQTTYEQLKNSIDEVTNSMLRRAMVASQEKAIQTVYEKTADEISNAQSKLKTFLEGEGLSREEISGFFKFIELKAKETEGNLANKGGNPLLSLLQEYLGDSSISGAVRADYMNEFNNYADALYLRKTEELKIQEMINGAYQDTFRSAEALNAINAEEEAKKKRMAALDKETLGDYEYNKQLKEIQKQSDLNKIQIKLEFGEITNEEAERQRNAIIAWADGTTKDINDKITSALSKYGEEFTSSFLIDKERQDKGLSEYEKEVQTGWEMQKGIVEDLNRRKNAGVIIDEKDLELAQKQKAAWEAVASILGIQLEKEKETNKKRDRSLKLLQERVKLLKEMNQEYEKNLKFMDAETAEKTVRKAYSATASKLGIDLSKGWNNNKIEGLEKEIDKVNELKDVYQHFLDEGLSVEAAKAKFVETYGKTQVNAWEEWIEELKAVIRDNEDFREEAYKSTLYDDKGNKIQDVWTFGYGFIEGVQQGDRITKEEAEKRLDKEVRDHMQYVIDAIEDANMEINKNQFLSLADLRYQTPPATVQKIIREAKGDMEYIAKALETAGTTIKGKYIPNLQGRADDRVALFSKEVEGLTLKEGQSVEDYLSSRLDSLETRLEAEKKLKEELEKLKPFSDEGTIKALEDMLAKAKNYDEYMEIAKTLDNYRAEILNDIAEKKQEALQKDVDEIFDMVELTKELKKLGFSEELAETFGFEFIDLDDARTRIEALKADAEKLGDKGVEICDKALKQINDLEVKAARERMKTYSKYLLEGMSERVKLKIEEMRKLKEIEEADEFTPEQKERITQGVNAETRKALQKQEWEDFKGSEMYTMMFEDLENYGTKALELLRDKIELLKGSLSDLDAPEVKEIISQLNKIDDVIIARKPGAALQNIRQQLADRGVGTSDEETKALETAESIEKNAQEEIDLIHRVQAARQQNLTLTIEDEAAYASLLDTQYGSVEAEQEILDANKEIVDSAQDEQAKRRKNLNLLNQEKQAQIAKLNKANEYLDVVGRGLQAGKELLETVTGETDGVGSAIADAGIGMLSLIQSAITMQAQFIATGIAANSALGIIGWIAIALEAVVMLLSAIFSAKDKALEKQMEEHLATVEKLQEAYDRLETAIDEAFSTKQLERYARETQKLTAEIIRAQEAAIAANKARKQTDEVREQTAEMEKELAALKEQENETLGDIFSSATDGILDNVADAARDFVDAWYDAFIETGDGLKGLEENFNEMFLNLAKQQAAQQIVGAYADMWKKDLNKYINAESGDLTLTKDEAKRWAEEVRATFPQLSEALEGFLGTITEGLGTTGGGSLTALQKGIQGATAEQAEVIQSYLNSVRLYVATNGEELKKQTTILNNIYTLLNSMTTSDTQFSARAWKTSMK